MTLKKLLSGVAVASLLVGCTVTVGPGGDGGNSDSGSNPDATTNDSGGGNDAATDGGVCPAVPAKLDFAPPDSCNTCMAGKCCAAVTACANSTGDAGSDTCMDYNDCLNPCANLSGQARTACIQTCDTGHPSGKAIFDAMDTCLVNNCNAECP